MIWYMIWYDMIWYMIWYDMIWYDMIWYDMIWYYITLHYISHYIILLVVLPWQMHWHLHNNVTINDYYLTIPYSTWQWADHLPCSSSNQTNATRQQLNTRGAQPMLLLENALNNEGSSCFNVWSMFDTLNRYVASLEAPWSKLPISKASKAANIKWRKMNYLFT